MLVLQKYLLQALNFFVGGDNSRIRSVVRAVKFEGSRKISNEKVSLLNATEMRRIIVADNWSSLANH